MKGLLNTNGESRRGKIGQLPILGHVEELPSIVEKHGEVDILATAGQLRGDGLRKLMDVCHEEKLPLKIIPRLEDRIHGDKYVPLREIKIDDLLRRDPVELDTASISQLIEGQTVLVTGAGGSIGSEICRQVIKFKPCSLILLGRGENRIFTIYHELNGADSSVSLHPVIGDIGDMPRMRQVFTEFRPKVVFHAAAHKHVPLMELNVGEAVKNNLIGTQRLADVAREFGVKRFVLISSDKAVRPTSVMGATKQLAERYVKASSETSETRFMAVRFGNVLGSANSVVPIFQNQIRSGGPITITDPRMKRYFMTIPEASRLVLQAAAIGRGGEVFLLEMGDPVKITDLAQDLVRLSGLPRDSIEIKYTGIRPGEKLFEELSFENELTLPTSHPKVRAMYDSPYGLREVRESITELAKLVDYPERNLRDKLHECMDECRQLCDSGQDRTPKDVYQ